MPTPQAVIVPTVLVSKRDEARLPFPVSMFPAIV